MRHLINIAIVLLATAFVSCGKTSDFVGVVRLHDGNSLVVLNPIDDTQYTFATDATTTNCDISLPEGTPVIVTYKGRLTDGTKAMSVEPDKTYIMAVGKWITSDIDDVTSQCGLELRAGGRVSPIGDFATDYHTWELQGEENILLLNGHTATGEQIIHAAIIDTEQTLPLLTIEDSQQIYRKVL